MVLEFVFLVQGIVSYAIQLQIVLTADKAITLQEDNANHAVKDVYSVMKQIIARIVKLVYFWTMDYAQIAHIHVMNVILPNVSHVYQDFTSICRVAKLALLFVLLAIQPIAFHVKSAIF